jgi:hypothetical protein
MSQQIATREEDKLSGWLARPEVNGRIGEALGGYSTRRCSSPPPDPHSDQAGTGGVLGRQPVSGDSHLRDARPDGRLSAGGPDSTGQAVDGDAAVAGLQGAVRAGAGSLWKCGRRIVHVNDLFEVAGDAPDLIVSRHQYDPFDPERKIEKLEDIRGSYIVVTFRDGRPPRYHFASAAYISKCRNCAQTRAIWDKWFEQMALKTAFRSAFSRRVVNVDPMVAGKLEAFTRYEDSLLGQRPPHHRHAASPADRPSKPVVGHRRPNCPAADSAHGGS